MSRALKVVISHVGRSPRCGHTVFPMHSGQDHRAILASQMKWDSDDDREEMRYVLQSLGISVAWSQI